MAGNNRDDSPRANKATGIQKRPADMVWHHVEDGKTMQLVPRKLHDFIKHTGGAARIKETNKKR